MYKIGIKYSHKIYYNNNICKIINLVHLEHRIIIVQQIKVF
jgi:hypothetical protein